MTTEVEVEVPEEAIENEVLDKGQVDTPPEDQPEENTEFEVILDGEDETPASDSVPLAAHLKKVNKFKKRVEAATQDVSAKDEEIRLLKMQIELQNKPKEQTFPKLEDFDYDDAAYQKAVMGYNQKQTEKLLTEKLQAYQGQQTQTVQQQQSEKAFNSAYETHLKRAAELNIDPTSYDEAENKVIEVMGNDVVKEMIGAGFEPYLFTYLSKNPNKMANLAHLVKTQPVKALREVAALEARLKIKPKSSKQIPEPNDAPQGGSGGTNSYQKRLDAERAKADKAGGKYDMSAVRQIRLDAQNAGISLT